MTATRSCTVRLLTAAVTVTVTVAVLGGCSAGGDDAGNEADARPTSADASTPSPVTTPSTKTARSAGLIAEPSGGQALCLEQRADSALTAMFNPIAEARGDLTITKVSAVGTDVRLVAAEGVVVTSKPAFGPGLEVGGGWPMHSDRLQRKTDLSTRQELRGMELTDGQRVLPLFRVRAAKGALLDALELSWTDANDDSGTVALPVGTRFSGGRCAL
jgi:hypothetical protein